MKVKKINSKNYKPIFIDAKEKESKELFSIRMAVKIFLVCLSAAGLGIALAEIYRIPVEKMSIVLVSFSTVVLISLWLMLLKKRTLLVPPILFLCIVGAENIAGSILVFYNHMLLTLDSRLLSTGRSAFLTLEESRTPENIRATAQVFLVLCVVISLVFAIGTYSRFNGTILITTMLLLTPAFGAEKAGYVSGMNILLVGMVGTFTMWVSHAKIDSKPYKSSKKCKKESQNEQREPIYKITPGKIPVYYKHSRNSIIAAVLVLLAVTMSAALVPKAVRFDFNAVVNWVRQIPVSMPKSVREFAKHNFGSINGAGFFPGDSDISQSITLGRPPTGNIPIIRVTLENDSEKVYLRGGIGIDFTEDEWTLKQNSPEYESLLELVQNFSPELEYHVLRQKATEVNDVYGYGNGYDIMTRQNVEIEYLARTKFLLLPTQPYSPDYKTNPDYTWYSDSYIRPAKGSKKATTTVFDTLHPDASLINIYEDIYNYLYKTPDGEILTIYEIQEAELSIIKSFQSGDYEADELWQAIEEKLEEFRSSLERVPNNEQIDTGWEFPDGTTTEEYNEKIKEYASLVNSVYTNVPENEADNMDRLIDEINKSFHQPNADRFDFADSQWWGPRVLALGTSSDSSSYHHSFIVSANLSEMNDFNAVQSICDYLRVNYAYSLSTDNKVGDNTTIGNFLFENRRGHCAMYASSMTLAVRRLGLPARYVTGLVTVGSAGTVQTMAEKDFHAWVEVYFEGLGWIPFDPTGGANGLDGGNAEVAEVPSPVTTVAKDETAPPPVTTPSENASETTTTSEPSISSTSSENADNPSNETQSSKIDFKLLFTIVLVILVPFTVVGLSCFLLNSLRKKETAKFKRFKEAYNSNNNKTAGEMYHFMLNLLTSAGFTPKQGETPLKFAARVDADGQLEPGPTARTCESVMTLFEKFEFGNVDVDSLDSKEYDLMYEYTSALYNEVVLKKKQPLRFFLQVYFLTL